MDTRQERRKKRREAVEQMVREDEAEAMPGKGRFRRIFKFKSRLRQAKEEKEWRASTKKLIEGARRQKKDRLKKEFDYKEDINEQTKFSKRLLKAFERYIFRDYLILSVTNGWFVSYYVFRNHPLSSKFMAMWGVLIWNLMLFTGPIESYYFNYNALRDNEYSYLIRQDQDLPKSSEEDCLL
ncbi:unnamed protein product [Moneuplotes crassus]|uniref:Uncharacterized protein n=2 Tax=Euplotes crassus TaxID=5936 RepID=A0AAD2D818_EUPCR|nr:unnamed protein product [Moneuplotes crassus]